MGPSHLETDVKQRTGSIQQTPVRLPKKKIHKRNTQVVYEAKPNAVCPRCQMVPPEKRMMLAHTKVAKENPSLKHSLLESLEHSSRLMQYKVTLNGKSNKFYNMPPSYYQQLRDKKRRKRECSQITVSVGSCSCPQEIATRESQRVNSNSPQSRKEKDKLIRQSAKNLCQPYVPCRRTCSTLHHPHIHETRVTMIQAARLRSTGRLAKLKASIISKAEQMQMKQESERPASVDSGIRKKNELLSQIDWVNSKIYMNIQFYNQQNNKEGGANGDLKDTLGKGETPFGDDPILFFIKNAESGYDNLDIYSETEVRYLLDLMKQKFEDNDVGVQAEVNYVFEKALRTLECYMNMLLLNKAFDSIKEQYQQTTNKHQTVVNCIKVLMRCSKMTEAIISVKKILKTIIQREQLVTGAIEKGDKNKTLANYDRIITLTMRIFKMIERLQDENHNLRRPFIIHREEYKETTITQMKFMKEAIEKQFEVEVERIINSQGELELVQKD